MSQAKISANVRTISPQLSIIDIRGEVNTFAEKTLMDAFTQANTPEVQVIALNFAGLEYMNSSGVGLLITLLIRVQRQHKRLIAIGLTEHYREIFEVTRLNEAIALYASEAEAVAALNMPKPQR